MKAFFKDAWEKARYLDGCARLEALQSVVCGLIGRLGLLSLPHPVRAVRWHQWVRDNIQYVRDPGLREELADCATILTRRPPRDDCDGKCRVLVAGALAAGLDARIRPVFPAPNDFRHVQADLRWPGSNQYPNADADGWVPAEVCLDGVPLGFGAERARWLNGQPVTR